jgi:hypothetical protein
VKLTGSNGRVGPYVPCAQQPGGPVRLPVRAVASAKLRVGGERVPPNL